MTKEEKKALRSGDLGEFNCLRLCGPALGGLGAERWSSVVLCVHTGFLLVLAGTMGMFFPASQHLQHGHGRDVWSSAPIP